MNKKEDLKDTERIFGKKYNLKDFYKLSDVKKKHRIIDIILNEHTYDAMAIFYYLVEKSKGTGGKDD